MPLITGRKAVLNVYADMERHGWVMPCFCTENQTSTEAILAAALEASIRLKCPDLPVTIAVTNLYSHRSQSVAYSHTGRWDIGMKLFLADLRVLTEASSPYGALRVLVHLDHIQPDADHDLLNWDLGQFSSIMYDASTLPFEQNIERTRNFMREHGQELVVEGACDEIMDAGGQECNALTTPERAVTYVNGAGVDFIVANLGTEHRASAAELTYHGDLAMKISSAVGGGARNPALLKLKASVLGTPIVPVAVTEAGCLGMAMLGHAACEGIPVSDLVPTWIRTLDPVLPDPALADHYARRFEEYRLLYKDTRTFAAKLKQNPSPGEAP
jgi:fructose/tagatose bisphosphate aldolase